MNERDRKKEQRDESYFLEPKLLDASIHHRLQLHRIIRLIYDPLPYHVLGTATQSASLCMQLIIGLKYVLRHIRQCIIAAPVKLQMIRPTSRISAIVSKLPPRHPNRLKRSKEHMIPATTVY